MTPDFDLDAWRDQIPLLRTHVPMNACSRAPLIQGVREAARTWLDSWDSRGMDWDLWIDEVDRARTGFADLIGAAPEEIALAGSVSQATNSLLSALSYTERPAIVASLAEFPTVGQALTAQARRGAEVRWVPARDGVASAHDYAAVCDRRTALVSITHAAYQTGARLDVKTIAARAREVGAISFVDAYQTLGAEPVDVRALGVDALCGGTLKYLMGAPGLAFLYVRRELAEQLQPQINGWFGRRDPMEFDPRGQDWADGALRFDLGTPPDINAYMARAGLDVVRTIGPDAIRAWGRHLAGRMTEQGLARGWTILGPQDPDARTAMTAFRCPVDSHDVEVGLKRRGILASGRGPAIRLAPHFFNTEEDVDRAIEALAAVFEELS